MKNIFYWSPFIGNVATIKAVINSAFSFSKFSKGKYLPFIINCGGEWNYHEKEIEEKKINTIDLQNNFRINTKINGFFKSRLEFLKIFINCYFPLKNLLKKNHPEYLIVHLITSLPLILYLFNKFETKLVIRVSGKVKFNFIRRLIWKLSSNSIHLITCPTLESLKEIKKLNIIKQEKIIFLPDPVIDIKEINKNKKVLIELPTRYKYFLSIGRFTKQKNHILLIKAFANLLKILKDIELIIIGDGELKDEYLQTIESLGIKNKIHLIGYQKNIYPFINNSLGIISTSLWEDPGFVMIEAAACEKFVISSNCPSGPEEFISSTNGILFQNNDLDDLEKQIKKYLILDDKEIFNIKLGAKKKSKIFTKLNHYKIFSNYLI